MFLLDKQHMDISQTQTQQQTTNLLYYIILYYKNISLHIEVKFVICKAK